MQSADRVGRMLMQHSDAATNIGGEDGHGGHKVRSAQSFWKRYFEFYDTLNESIPYREMIERQAELLEASPGDLILDAGTGTGNVAVALLARGARVIGTDFCESALEKCRDKAPAGDFRFADLTEGLEFGSEHFDKVSCTNVFQFLDPKSHAFAVGELFRVLRPGGLLALTVFAAGFNSFSVLRETLRQKRNESGAWLATLFGVRYSVSTIRILYYVWRIKRREKRGDYAFFSKTDLTGLLEQAGFEVVAVKQFFASQCITALVRKPASRRA
jgi:ubiquinone/menaquinone biosynthesis C-methylase UbiE